MMKQTFSLKGHLNRQLTCYGPAENSHCMQDYQMQRPQKIIVWAGIAKNFLNKI